MNRTIANLTAFPSGKKALEFTDRDQKAVIPEARSWVWVFRYATAHHRSRFAPRNDREWFALSLARLA